MFPSFQEFKSSEQLYDPYFPVHHQQLQHGGPGDLTGASPPPQLPHMPPVTSEAAVINDPYNTYQNGSVYTQYSQPQSWSGSSTGSQPSPQPQNYSYGPPPGEGGGPGPPPNGNDYYNSPSYNTPQTPSNNQSMGGYYPSPQQNQSQQQYDQYTYNYNGGHQQWGSHPPPGSSPPLYQQYGIKSEYDMKPSPPPSGPTTGAPPGAMPYYNNGHASPHLMGMPQQQQPMMSPVDNWGNSPKLTTMTPPGFTPPPPNQPPSQPPHTNGKRPLPHQTKITDDFKAVKKPRSSAASKRANNRFNGMSEEEVAKRGLPDYMKAGLDIVFIGINPSMFAAYTGKYYDGPGNHFWQALYLSGILAEPMSAVDDHKLLDLGIGFTNIVPRTTRGLSDLSRKEIADGAEVIISGQHAILASASMASMASDLVH